MISPRDEKFYEMAAHILKNIDNPELSRSMTRSLIKELCTFFSVSKPKVHFTKHPPKTCFDKDGKQLYSAVYRNFFYLDGKVEKHRLDTNSITFYNFNPYLSTICHEFTHHLQVKHIGFASECEDHVFGTLCVMKRALKILDRMYIEK